MNGILSQSSTSIAQMPAIDHAQEQQQAQVEMLEETVADLLTKLKRVSTPQPETKESPTAQLGPAPCSPVCVKLINTNERLAIIRGALAKAINDIEV